MTEDHVVSTTVRVLEERVGKRIGLFDRMTSKSLAVTKAVDITELCPKRRGRKYPVKLEYTENCDGVGVIFRDEIPYDGQPWRAFAVMVKEFEKEQEHAGIPYCAEQVGLSLFDLATIITENAPEATGTTAVLVVPTCIGEHTRVSDRGPDINRFAMVICGVCKTRTDNEEDLAKTPCNPHCRNCNALRGSGTHAPAVPMGGGCNDLLHICPIDGNKWWQSNNHFHQWQQVTSDSSWNNLLNRGSGRSIEWFFW